MSLEKGVSKTILSQDLNLCRPGYFLRFGNRKYLLGANRRIWWTCDLFLLLFPFERHWCRLYGVHPKNYTMTLMVGRLNLDIFGADSPGQTHCLECSQVSDVLWLFHVSSTVMILQKNLSRMQLNNEVVLRLCLWPNVTNEAWIVWTDIPYPSDNLKSEIPSDVIRPLTFQYSVGQHQICFSHLN